MGGGSWATALAKLLLQNCDSIYWYMRRDDRIADFKRTGHNPVYLSDIVFDTARINFSSDINEVCGKADTPHSKSIASASVVLPDPLLPIKAVFLISLVP